MAESHGPIPTTIISGFLGAGKTTLLKRILDDPQGVRYGVLINDFGAVNIDAELVIESAADQVTLENGCVCCTIRDDLVGAIVALIQRDPPPDRLVVEASGVSRPLPIADALKAGELADRVELDGVFCVVDGANFADLDYQATELALDQAAGADIVIVNKTDVATPEQISAIETTLTGALPRLRLVRTRHASLPFELLFGVRPDGAEPLGHRLAAGHARNHHHDHDHSHHHGGEFEAWHWRSDRPVDEARLRAVIKALPSSLMRAKGVLRPTGDGSRLVFHLVGKRSQLFHEDVQAPAVSSIVVIGRRSSFDPAALASLFDGCIADV